MLQEQYEKNMQGLVGSLFDPSEEEDIPLLYFHSFMSFFKWVCSWAIPGLGMFSEAYFVFSIGNIKPILADQYPACWFKYTVRLCASEASLVMCIASHAALLMAQASVYQHCKLLHQRSLKPFC